MPAWKILNLIESIHQKEETEEFRIWLTKRTRISESYENRLFEILLDSIINHQAKELTGEKCWDSLRTGEKYEDGKLRQYRLELKSKIERFWLEKAITQDEDMNRLLLFRILSERNLNHLVEKAYNQEVEKMSNKQILSLEDLKFLFEAELLMNQVRVQEVRTKHSYLPQIIARFIDYAQTYYLKLVCINISDNSILGISDQPAFLEELLNLLAKKNLSASDGLLYIYFEIYKFLEGSRNEIQSILELLHAKNISLNKEELKDIFALLHNGIIQRINSGGFHKWAPQQILLYQWAMQANIILESGYIDPRLYRNIISISLRLENFDDAETFLEDWKKYLPPNSDEYYRFCKGYYHYIKKEYDKIVGSWDSTEPFKNTTLRISAELVRLQALYEQHWGNDNPAEMDYIKERIKNLNRYIKSQKRLSELHKKIYSTRLGFFKKLLKKLSRNELLQLLEAIEHGSNIGNQDWFKYQIRWRLELDDFSE